MIIIKQHRQYQATANWKPLTMVVIMVCMLFAMPLAAQNVLRVSDITAAAGKEAFLPIYLDNSDDIVGMQFDISIPYAKSNSGVVLMDARSNGHTVSLRKISKTKYTVVVMSLQNKTIRGNAGLLLRFPIQIADDAQADDTFPVQLSNIVLTNVKGRNMATSTTSEATFTVLRTPTPDLLVSDLQIANTDNLEPNGPLQLNFNVENQGTGDSGDGWTEKVYLEDVTGYRVYVGTRQHNATIGAGETISRNYELTLPKVMKTDGEVSAVVELVPTKKTNELIADQGNNTSLSSNTKTLTKRLFLSSSRIALDEGKSTKITLTRSGDWAMAETYTLTEQNEHGEMMLTLPATVTIKAKQSSATFTVTATNNDQVNEYYRTGLAVEGNGYDAVSMVVDVEDDDQHALTLTTDKSIYTEGEIVTLTATIKGTLSNDLKIDIGKTSANRFSPAVRSITIPAGLLTASVTTSIVDDNYPMLDETVTFTASASGYDTSKAKFVVQDNDWPLLTATFSRSIISEGDGYGATSLIIKREGNIQENLTVLLSSNAGQELFFDSKYNIIPAGKTTIEIPVSVEDNSKLDSERTWTIGVASLDAVTEKAVPKTSEAYCEVALMVTDDETEGTLKLSSKQGQLVEGGGWVTMTVERNSKVGETLVTLSCEDEQVVFENTQVTIANGKTSTTFRLKATANTLSDDDHYFSVVARAEGYQPASFLMMISDKTLPDGILVGAPIVSLSRGYGGQMVDVTFMVANQGLTDLPAGTPLPCYLTTDKTFRYSLHPSDNAYTSPHWEMDTPLTPVAVEPGETVEMTFTIPLTYGLKEKEYYVMGWLNFNGGVDELNDLNGLSKTTPVYLMSPFTVKSLETDEERYCVDDVMHIEGQMDNTTSGVEMDGKKVDVYIVNSTNVRTVMKTVELDNEGRFSFDYKLTSNYGGSYGLGACTEDAGTYDVVTRIGVSALSIEKTWSGSKGLQLTLTEGVPLEGNLRVTNRSDETLYQMSYAMEGLPKGWSVELTPVTSLAGGITTNIHYCIVPNSVSTGSNWQVGTFNVSGKDSDGNVVAEASLRFGYYCQAAQCQLVADVDKQTGLKTTVWKHGKRSVTVNLMNTGRIATGNIKVECPQQTPWLSATVSQLASIESESVALLTLSLTGQDDMLVDGVYTSYVKLTPENGTPLIVQVHATAVSTDKGVLKVDVVDAYTLGEEDGADGPHVKDATVRLTNALTKEVVMTGTTGEDGLFTVDDLQEGTYYVYVTAPNHYYTEKTITVNPGVENSLEVFLHYQAVKIHYTVERTTVVDEYKTVLWMDVVPDIPQAIVVPTLPSNFGCGLSSYSIRLTNKGKLTAYTPYLEFPDVDGYTFTVKNNLPDVLYPNESYDVIVEFEGTEDRIPSFLGSVVMNYAYKLRGETYWGKEVYAAQVGCYDMPYVLYGGSSFDGGSGGSMAGMGGEDFGGGGFFAEIGKTGQLDFPEVKIRDYSQDIDNRVRLQFEQSFFLEREAFKGSLTIENLQMNDIEHINMVPTVKTMDGEDATDLFAVSVVGTSSWNSSGDWALAASQTGRASVLYVPSKETAPTEPVAYLFGGTVTYRDVATGLLKREELMPTKLTVNPSPDLHLTYFVQRDFISDDPLTDEVESWEPVEFGLLIQNKGAGAALNLRIETSEPEIVENQNNLPVTFTQLYTTVDGKAGHYDFNNLNLGKIEAGQNVMARWWFYSNVSAHVANYNAVMTKASNYGEEFNLITLDGVRELTRSVSGVLSRPNEAKVRRAPVATTVNTETGIFLLNMIEDEDNLPDYVMDYTGEGTDDLEIVNEKMNCIAGAIEGQYILTVNASRDGWVYGVMHDPTNCAMKLARVVRNSDGAELTTNVWQTERTVLSDFTTIVDNRLHIADNIASQESYTLYYESKPTAAPKVKSIELQFADGEDESLARSAIVTFTEAIDMTTVDSDDVVMLAAGKQQTVKVTVLSDKSIEIDWSANRPVPGACSLSIFTSGIKNTEGIAGTTSSMKEWTATVIYSVGDVNGDGEVNVTDVGMVIDHILERTPTNFILSAADANGDGKVNVTDVGLIIGIILNDGASVRKMEEEEVSKMLDPQ